MGRECISGLAFGKGMTSENQKVIFCPAGECCKVLSKRQQRIVDVVLLNLNSLEPIKQKREEGIDWETVDPGDSLSCSVASGNGASNNKLGFFP